MPAEILPLLRRVDEYLEERRRQLLVVFDQFEEYLIALDREPKREDPLRPLLAELQGRSALGSIRVLLAFRSDYEGDISRLDLPRLGQDVNWKQVDSFPEPRARDFLHDGFEGKGIGPDLIDQVVRHASELDETRGKVRPVVLNMIGLALASRSGKVGSVLGPRESQGLMLDHIRDGLKNPLARDYAPQILEEMVTPEGRKQKPASAADLSERTKLDVPLIQGCLARLQWLGFVRPFQSDHEQAAGTQVWEVSHDFIARLLSLILPGWKPSIWSRLIRAALGPALVTLGIVAVLGISPRRLRPRRHHTISKESRGPAITGHRSPPDVGRSI